MREDALEEQRDLVDLIESAGWAVTETDLSLYESPWEDTNDPEATVTITARKAFSAEDDGEDASKEDATDEDGDEGDNPYRVN